MSSHRARSSTLPRMRCMAEGCTRMFHPYHRAQRFCSPECRDLERGRERRAAEGNGNPRRAKRFTTDALAAVMDRLRLSGKMRAA